MAGIDRPGSRGGDRDKALETALAQIERQFGDTYAASVAKDYVLADLGGRTVDQALAEGIEPKRIWRAVCEAFEIPEEAR